MRSAAPSTAPLLPSYLWARETPGLCSQMLRMKAFQQYVRKGQPCSDPCLQTQRLSLRSAARSSALCCPHACSIDLKASGALRRS